MGRPFSLPRPAFQIWLWATFRTGHKVTVSMSLLRVVLVRGFPREGEMPPHAEVVLVAKYGLCPHLKPSSVR